jgi:uncharacterized RDD family membrane protein YckC
METPQPPERPGQAEPPSPQAPPPPPPAGPQSPSPQAPTYGGPVPPGGWEQPIAQQQPGWTGRQLASWGSRFAAQLIDWLILLVPVVILTVIVIGIAAGSDTGAIVTGIVSFLAYLVVALLYAPLLMARDGEHNGQTWGKQLLGITVVRDGGEPMTFAYAALREIVVKGFGVGIAASIIPVIPYLLNYLWPLWDDSNRAIHDIICSTHVVRT